MLSRNSLCCEACFNRADGCSSDRPAPDAHPGQGRARPETPIAARPWQGGYAEILPCSVVDGALPGPARLGATGRRVLLPDTLPQPPTRRHRRAGRRRRCGRNDRGGALLGADEPDARPPRGAGVAARAPRSGAARLGHGAGGAAVERAAGPEPSRHRAARGSRGRRAGLRPAAAGPGPGRRTGFLVGRCPARCRRRRGRRLPLSAAATARPRGTGRGADRVHDGGGVDDGQPAGGARGAAGAQGDQDGQDAGAGGPRLHPARLRRQPVQHARRLRAGVPRLLGRLGRRHAARGAGVRRHGAVPAWFG